MEPYQISMPEGADERIETLLAKHMCPIHPNTTLDWIGDCAMCAVTAHPKPNPAVRFTPACLLCASTTHKSPQCPHRDDRLALYRPQTQFDSWVAETRKSFQAHPEPWWHRNLDVMVVGPVMFILGLVTALVVLP